MEVSTNTIASSLTVCGYEFQRSLAAARLKLDEARGFTTAAQAQRQAHVLAGSTLAVDEGDSDILMMQAQEAVSDALSMLQDPSILTDPSMASERAQLILQGATIASGFGELGKLTQSCLELLTVDFGGCLPSKMELALSEEALWAEKARNYLCELSRSFREFKTDGYDTRPLWRLDETSFATEFHPHKWASACYRQHTNVWQRLQLEEVAVSSWDIPWQHVSGWQGMVLKEIAFQGYTFYAYLWCGKKHFELQIGVSL